MSERAKEYRDLFRTSANAMSDRMDVHAENAVVAVADGVDSESQEREMRPLSNRTHQEGAAVPSIRSVRAEPKSETQGWVACVYSELSDQELLDGVRLESEPHFTELYRRYFQRIYNFVYTRMRNHAETEEVVQETFLVVFRSFGNYRGQSSLLSWIYGIAKNTTNNSLRRSKSQTERIDLADDEDLLPRSSMGAGSPEEQLDLQRFQGVLSRRLAGLADWQTEIFHLRHFENLSIPEISARTSRSSDAVRSSLYRVKRIFFEAASNSTQTVFSARGARR